MACAVLPASPSWYCSRVVDSNDYGLLCFGAKHSIYIFDTAVDPPRFRSHLPAHQDRVVGLSFGRLTDQQSRLCSASEDGKVKIWDLRDNTLCGEHSEHKHKLTAVHWSPVDKDLIVSCDEKGGIIVWQPLSGELKALSPEPNTIFSLACSEHMANIVAVGYKNGLVLVLDLNKKGGSAIVQKLRGHDDEIHSIVWCSQQGLESNWRRKNDHDDDGKNEDATADVKSDYILATGSRDKTIRIWSFKKGKPLHILHLPHQTGSKRNWEDGGVKQRVWVTLYWPPQRPQELVSSSFNGDLLLWDLVRPGSKSWHVFGGGGIRSHNRIVFNIASAGTDGTGVCSVSMDRKLILWNAETLSPTHMISTLGGFVYCIAQSPIHPGRLAVGVGDSLVRVWNIENQQEPYNVNVFWQGIKSKVMTLCWHPKKEAHLAFGTDDGKVGILDILAGKSYISSTYHRKTVYVVSWGPACCIKDTTPPATEYMLYSCGDGNVQQHNPSNLDKDAMSINYIIKKNNNMENRPPGRSEVSWKPDFSLVALGNEDGSVDILRPPFLSLVCSVQVHHKLVNCVRWHPEYTAETVNPSPCSSWLAIGSNESVIHVVDVKKVTDAADDHTGPAVVTESFCQLEGHTNRITGLSWSTHTEGRLASVSYDWTAQVWDVKKCEPLANYRAHHGRLLSVLYSSLDPDVVYTGGDDFTIQGWKISEQPHRLPPAGSEKQRYKNKKKGGRTKGKAEFPSSQRKEKDKADTSPATNDKSSVVDEGAGGDVMAEINALLEQKKAELLLAAEAKSSEGAAVKAEDAEAEGTHLEPTTSTQSYPKVTLEPTPSKKDPSLKKEQKEKAKRKARSLFPLSSTMDNRGKLHTQGDCVSLMKAKSNMSDGAVGMLPQNLCHLGHFLDRKNAYQLFDYENEKHLEQGNYDQFTMLEIFKGNPAESVRMLSEKQELNDFTVAMSALASMQTWRNTCTAYSKQLEKEGNYPKAASYILAAQGVYEAISMLQRNGHYKDAICLAQVRLSPHDPVIKRLYSNWGYQLASDGNFELAAKCYIANDQPIEAAKLLARRSDLSALRVASEICISNNDLPNARVYCHRHTLQCMLNLDWAEAAELINKHDQLKLHGLIMTTHQILVHQLSNLGSLKDVDVSQGAMYTRQTQTGPSGDNKLTLPWLLHKPSGVREWLPWTPCTVEGEAFLHHLIRQWHLLWDIRWDMESLNKLNSELTVLIQTRQAHTAVKQIVIELSCNITMVTIKMLLGNMEEAAHWLSMAMATCHENDLDELSEGMNRLLLPTGPENLWKLQQEVRALRMSAIQQQASVLSAHQMKEVGQDVDSEDQTHHTVTADQVYNDSEDCSPTDCVTAFYYFTVIKFFSKQTGNGTKEKIMQMSPPSGATSPAQNGLTIRITGTCLKEISHSLLWNAQIRKQKLQDSLKEIQRATMVLINKHTATKIPTDNPEIESDDKCERSLVYPSTPNIADVSLVKFQKENQSIIHRSPENDRISNDNTSAELRVFIPLQKPHEKILYSPLKSPGKHPLSRSSTDPEEFLTMQNPDGTETEEVTGILTMSPLKEAEEEVFDLNPALVEESLTAVGNGTEALELNNHDNVPCGTMQASEESSSEIHHSGSKPQTADIKSENLDTETDSKELDSSVNPCVPAEWHTLPLSQKYTMGYVDLKLLTTEQHSIQEELAHLSKKLAECPFPHPERSVILLLEVVSHQSDAEDMHALAAEFESWRREHCYSERALSSVS